MSDRMGDTRPVRLGEHTHFCCVTEGPSHSGEFVAQRFDQGRKFVYILERDAARVIGGLAIGDLIECELRQSVINGDQYGARVKKYHAEHRNSNER